MVYVHLDTVRRATRPREPNPPHGPTSERPHNATKHHVGCIAAAVVLAPSVEAAPKLCDNHGGHVYIHACATGGGGGGDAGRMAAQYHMDRLGINAGRSGQSPEGERPGGHAVTLLIIAGAIVADLVFAICVGKWLKGRAPAEHERVVPVLVGGLKP